MIDFSPTEIANILNAEFIKDSEFKDEKITHVVTDSRNYFKGEHSIFFALIGPRNNGHVYIPNLIKKGITTFVVSDRTVVQPGASFILVDNTIVALQKLAASQRQQQNYPVIGITGSNGKTIVKEWLHNLLSVEFKILRSPKSYNSQIGVPLSVLLMNSNFNLGIFEAGISQPGEMQNLEKIIQPDIGIFTNIGDAHQEGFDSLEQKIKEKLLLFKSCKKLIYNADNSILKSLAQDFCKNQSIEKIPWTLTNGIASVRFSAKKSDNKTEITATVNKEKYNFKIPFTDNSSIENVCHCFVAVLVLSKNPQNILPEFEKLYPVEMRLEIKQGINNCLLVNDYYNSDLNSLSIALSVLHQQAAKAHLYKQVILSDIQQTGLPKEELYKQVNKLLTDWKMEKIIGIGTEISRYSDLFSIKKTFYDSVTDFKNQFNRTHFQSSAILIKGARQFTFEKISQLLQYKAHQTQLEIDLNALVHNLNTFKNLLHPATKIMVMVKAFSYGSGDVEIASVLQYQNVAYLAVAVTDEGVLLRNAGIQTPIIVMNPEQGSFQQIIDYKLEPNIYSTELLESFIEFVKQFGVFEFPVHIKIDTGMNRLGMKTDDEIKKSILLIKENDSIKIQSVFSHLAASEDAVFDKFTLSQFARFEEVAALFQSSSPYKIDRHILNSAGIERFPDKQYEMVRLGIGLYGISNTWLALQNIGTLRSTVSQIKKVESTETVGYSRKGEITEESKIAVVPLGYADGIDRKLGNKKGSAFIKGKRVPIIGNICMDMLMLDVTGINVNIGDKVEIFGPNIPITEVSEKAGTIPYEILTGISQRVKRIYLQE
jgi:alanine racemase